MRQDMKTIAQECEDNVKKSKEMHRSTPRNVKKRKDTANPPPCACRTIVECQRAENDALTLCYQCIDSDRRSLPFLRRSIEGRPLRRNERTRKKSRASPPQEYSIFHCFLHFLASFIQFIHGCFDFLASFTQFIHAFFDCLASFAKFINVFFTFGILRMTLLPQVEMKIKTLLTLFPRNDKRLS